MPSHTAALGFRFMSGVCTLLREGGTLCKLCSGNCCRNGTARLTDIPDQLCARIPQTHVLAPVATGASMMNGEVGVLCRVRHLWLASSMFGCSSRYLTWSLSQLVHAMAV